MSALVPIFGQTAIQTAHTIVPKLKRTETGTPKGAHKLQADLRFTVNVIAPRAIFTEWDMIFRAKQTPGNFRWHVWGNRQDRSPCPTPTTADANCPQRKPPGWYSARHCRKNLIGIFLLTSKHVSRKRNHASRERPVVISRIVQDKPC